jgi:hypothetical protein
VRVVKSKTKIDYDRPTDGQVCLSVKPLIWGPRLDFCYSRAVSCLLIRSALSDERTGLSSSIAAGSRPRSHSRVRVPWESWPCFTISNSTLPQTWWARSPFFYSPDTGFHFRRFLRLAGISWRYLNPPPRGDLVVVVKCNPFILQEVLGRTNRLLSFDTTRTAQKTTRRTILLLLHVYSLQR